MPRASQQAIDMAKEVLAKIACYDPYFPKPNEGMLTAWSEHISLKNPDRDDMLAAVTKFYENSFGDVKPMPASITSLARQIRQDRVIRGDYRPPPDKSDDPDPTTPEGLHQTKKITMAEWEELHGEKFPKLVLGDKADMAESGVNPLHEYCDHCRASIGSPCTIPGTAKILTKVRAHETRWAKAEKRCGGLHHELPHTKGCELA